MSLQIRRGTAAEVATITPELGEPIYVTDTQSLVLGDGATQGGIAVTSNLQTIDVAQDTENGHNVAILYNSDNTGTIRLANLANNYAITAGSTGTEVTGPLSVSSTATFAGNLDGAEGFTANMTGFRAGWYGGTAGYAFKNDTDTGMFANGTGDLRFRVDGDNSALVDSTGWDFQNNIWVANTATVTTLKFGDGTEMITAASGGGSTSTFDQIQIGTSTYKLYIGQSPGEYSNQFFISGNAETNDKLFFDDFEYIQSNNDFRVNNTLTVQAAFIGLNTGTNARDFGYGSMPFNANNMKIELPNNGSSLFFAFKNPSGAARNIGFSRQGNIILQQGNIGLGFPNGIQMVSTDGGRAFVGVSTTTDGVLYSSRLGANTSTGVFQTVQTGAGVDFSTLLDYTGLFSVPRDLLVTTTATVATLKFGDGTTMTTAPTAGVAGDQSVYTTSSVTFDTLAVTNTATANEVVVGADLQAIKSQGYNVIGVDGNWRVGNVLEVGTGDGNGYITSTGNNSLTLQTSGNNGPGGSIVVGYGDGAGVSLYSGNSQEFQTAQFNTTSNTINYGLTVNGASSFNDTLTIKGLRETVYDWGSIGAGTYTPDVNSGTIHKMLLTGNITMNALTNVAAGSNATFIITQDGTGGRTLTSSWKFAGGAKTLTTAGTATDLISVFYDGSNYWASLSRGFV